MLLKITFLWYVSYLKVSTYLRSFFYVKSSHLKRQSTIAQITKSLWNFVGSGGLVGAASLGFFYLTCCRGSAVDQLADARLTPSHITVTIFNILGQTKEALEVMTTKFTRAWKKILIHVLYAKFVRITNVIIYIMYT